MVSINVTGSIIAARARSVLGCAVLCLAASGPLAGCAASTADDAASSEDALVAGQRAAIMNALRAVVKPELRNQDIQFDVSNGVLEVQGSFAFLTGKIVLKNSRRPVDYTGTPYADDIAEGLFDDHIDALLEKEGSTWVVKAHDIGATDVGWLEWPAQFGAPTSVFPFAPAAQAPQTNRAAVMDALRANLKPTLRNQDIVFNVTNGAYEAKGDWVFMRGVIRLRGTGAPADYRGTEYQQDIDQGMFDDGFGALLHKENASFVVKAVAVGPTDVAWTTWGTEYGAPAEIFR